MNVRAGRGVATCGCGVIQGGAGGGDFQGAGGSFWFDSCTLAHTHVHIHIYMSKLTVSIISQVCLRICANTENCIL